MKKRQQDSKWVFAVVSAIVHLLCDVLVLIGLNLGFKHSGLGFHLSSAFKF